MNAAETRPSPSSPSPDDLIRVSFATDAALWHALAATCPPKTPFYRYLISILQEAVDKHRPRPGHDQENSKFPYPLYVPKDSEEIVKALRVPRALWADIGWWKTWTGMSIRDLVTSILADSIPPEQREFARRLLAHSASAATRRSKAPAETPPETPAPAADAAEPARSRKKPRT